MNRNKNKAKNKETNLRVLLDTDPEVKAAFERLSEQGQKEMLAISDEIRVPNLLSDTIFKAIFDPDVKDSLLSDFISCILGRKVKVLHSLKNEGLRHSIYSKGIVLDIVVQFEDGSIANVEIQRSGIKLSPKRAACYSADIVTRQYAITQGQAKSEIDYDIIQPVYTIIIFEESPREFKETKKYKHFFQQKSDTGVELELLQYYAYICLDVFKAEKPRVGKKIDTWLEFLTIQDTDKMEAFLKKNKSFQTVYDRVILMSKDREGLMNMITDMLANEDIVGSINRTNESIIKRQRRELAEKDKILKEKEKTLKDKERTLKENEKAHQRELQKKEKTLKTYREELQEKDALIRELQQQLAAKKPD